MTLNKSTFLELTYGYSHNAIDIVPNVERATCSRARRSG